jgi:hypothetical protein
MSRKAKSPSSNILLIAAGILSAMRNAGVGEAAVAGSMSMDVDSPILLTTTPRTGPAIS